jgi:hypothetical protein
MANVNYPHGLRALLCLSGGPIQTEIFKKAATYATAIFRGDVVNRVADGSIEASATPGTTLLTGVALNYGGPSELTEHTVIVGMDTVFEAQGDDGTALDEADMGLNANLVLNAGNATTKISGHEIDASSKATTATLDVHLLKKLMVPDNDYGEFARIELLINKHRMAQGVAGV